MRKKIHFIRMLLLILLSPLLLCVFLLGFGAIILSYSLLFCFYVLGFCLLIIGACYSIHFFVSLFSFIPFAIFEAGVAFTAFALASFLFQGLGVLIPFLNKLIHYCFDRFVYIIRGGNYESKED